MRHKAKENKLTFTVKKTVLKLVLTFTIINVYRPCLLNYFHVLISHLSVLAGAYPLHSCHPGGAEGKGERKGNGETRVRG